MSVSSVSCAACDQAASLQSQIAISVLKSSIDADKSVLQLLAPAQSSSPSAANLAPGVGDHLDVSV